MSGKLRLRVLSPYGVQADTEADSVVLNAADGSLGVHKGHTPALVLLKNGDIKYIADGQTHNMKTDGYIAEVTPDGVTLLTR